MEKKIKVRVYKCNHSMNYGSGGFEYSGGKAIIIGNNDKLSNNLLIHACMTGHGECAYGDLESMECRDQDGGHSYYELLETVYIDSEKVSDWIKSAIEENEDHDIDDVNYDGKNKSEMKRIFRELEDILFIEDEKEINSILGKEKKKEKTKSSIGLSVSKGDWEGAQWTITGNVKKSMTVREFESTYDFEEFVENKIDSEGIEFDSESGQFFAYADTEERAIKFLNDIEAYFKVVRDLLLL